jgi:hypothetical protein
LQFFIYNIELDSHRDRFTVFLHGDDHYGANTTDEKAIFRFRDRVLEEGKNKNTRVNLMGDYCYSFPKNDTRREEGDYKKPDPLILYTEFRDIMRPIAHKVDCALIGNHDRDWVRAENVNFVHWMCAELKIPYGDYESFVRYKVKVKGKTQARRNIDFVLWHGDGGGRTSGASFNKVHNPVDVYRTPDVLAMGHVHRLGWLHEQYLQPNERHMDMQDVDQYFVLTGGYQKGFVAPKSTYISRKMLPPVAIGAVRLDIQPFHALDDTRDVLDIKFEEVR